MKTFVARHPTLFVAVSGLALVLVQYIWLFVIAGLSDAARTVSAKVAECILAILLLGALHWWREAGFAAHCHWRGFVPYLPLLIIPLLMVVSQLSRLRTSSLPQLLLFAAVAVMTGFAEETVFRGIAVRALLSKGVMKAALISSLIFGLLHLFNLLQGADPLATALQVVFAALIGIAFAAPLVYAGSIWPLIIIHAMQDFLAFWSTGAITNTATATVSEVVITVILMVPFAVYGLWLIQRRARAQLMPA